MKRAVEVESAPAFIDEKIKELGDWRGKTLAKMRDLIHEADPEIVEIEKRARTFWFPTSSLREPAGKRNQRDRGGKQP
jgi:hypothetical protein